MNYTVSDLCEIVASSNSNIIVQKAIEIIKETVPDFFTTCPVLVSFLPLTVYFY